MQIFDILEELEKERKKNKELEELCDKYEEEHKTTFEEWKRDINKITEIKEELNNLYNADQSERNYKVFIDKVDNILKGE